MTISLRFQSPLEGSCDPSDPDDPFKGNAGQGSSEVKPLNALQETNRHH